MAAPGGQQPSKRPTMFSRVFKKRAPVPDSSADIAQDQESRNPVREGALTVARRTFQIVETVSGAIPGVGDFVGVAAKVGLTFVNMIETMDKNEDVSKELT